MKIKTAFPLFQVPSPAEAAKFYVRHFQFETIFEADWYVQIRNGTQELAFIEIGHPSIPTEARGASQKTVLTLETEKTSHVDDLFLLVKDQMHVVAEPCDEEWGQRHFIGYDPSGIVLDVVCMLSES